MFSDPGQASEVLGTQSSRHMECEYSKRSAAIKESFMDVFKPVPWNVMTYYDEWCLQSKPTVCGLISVASPWSPHNSCFCSSGMTCCRTLVVEGSGNRQCECGAFPPPPAIQERLGTQNPTDACIRKALPEASAWPGAQPHRAYYCGTYLD